MSAADPSTEIDEEKGGEMKKNEESGVTKYAWLVLALVFAGRIAVQWHW